MSGKICDRKQMNDNDNMVVRQLWDKFPYIYVRVKEFLQKNLKQGKEPTADLTYDLYYLYSTLVAIIYINYFIKYCHSTEFWNVVLEENGEDKMVRISN